MGRFVNKFFLAVLTLAVSAVGASAADLAGRPYTKAPAAVAAAYDRSGFYIGANGGGHGAAIAGIPTRSRSISLAIFR
jgi:outer membrane immunogenic protein